MPYGPHRRFLHSFRFRAMFWNTAVVMIVAVATVFGMRTGIQRALVDEVDLVLIDDLKEVQLQLQAGVELTSLYERLELKAQAHDLQGWYVRFLDPVGDELWTSTSAPPKTPFTDKHPNFVPFTLDNRRVVQYVHPFSGHGRGPITVRIGSMLDRIEQDMHRIDRQSLLVCGILLLLAPTVGYWLAGTVTRPLAEITSTAERLRPSRMAERLLVRGTGDELDQLSRTINGLLDRLAKYLSQKEDFLANAAHELRTPLAAVRSTVEVALDGCRTIDEYREALVELIEQCSSLESLVNQLLVLAEIEGDSLALHDECMRLDDVVRRSIDMFSPVAEFREIDLQVELPDETLIDGNRHHLRQVINNLIDNALKYTPAGGRVTVTLRNDHELGRTRLTVADTGAGIPEADVARVFERFFRSDKARQRDSGMRGTGLGLSICQAVVHGCGGEIKLTSVLGQGTIVTVDLPLRAKKTSSSALIN